jgi:hypothetical protein
MLDPGYYTLKYWIEVPPEARLDVSFGSSRPATVTYGLFGERVPRDCSRRNRRVICSGSLEIEQHTSEEWTLAVRRLSAARAVVRLWVALTRVRPTQD